MLPQAYTKDVWTYSYLPELLETLEVNLWESEETRKTDPLLGSEAIPDIGEL